MLHYKWSKESPTGTGTRLAFKHQKENTAQGDLESIADGNSRT